MDRATKICTIVNRLAQGYVDKEIIQELNIPRRTYFYWKRRIETEGHDKVINKQKPGAKPTFSIDDDIKIKILHWRDRYGWGPTKIEGHLKVHFNINVPHNRIHQLFVETNRNNPISEPRKTWGRTRFERMHSNSLWQADLKLLENDYWMLTFIDDHARFILDSNERIWNPDTESVIKLLQKCFRFGMPEQILTDRGVQFWNNRSDKPAAFTQFCIDNSIQHIVASKRRPTTIGKIESYHGCYDKERWRFKTHMSFIHYWNYRRPNGAIGYLYPAEIFYRDMKSASNSG